MKTEIDLALENQSAAPHLLDEGSAAFENATMRLLKQQYSPAIS